MKSPRNRRPRAPSSVLAALGTLQLGALGLLLRGDFMDSLPNYYIGMALVGQHHSHTSSKYDQNWTTGKLLKFEKLVVVLLLLQFQLTYLKNCTELRHKTLCTDRYP